jgi:hypothetical protein
VRTQRAMRWADDMSSCAGWLHLSCAGLLIDAPVLDKTKNRKFRCPECKFRNKHSAS